MNTAFRFCPQCANPLAPISRMEDGGEKTRLRCSQCDYVNWNNPTPVLAGVVEYGGQILLARNAAWSGRMFALITGFMEADETPQFGIAREIKEETNLETSALELIGVYEFKRQNQIIIAYHAVCTGDILLSPELAEYRLYNPQDIKCWPAGTGYAMADWLKSRGHSPTFVEWPKPT